MLDQRGIVDRFLAAGKTMPLASFAHTTLDLSDCPTRHPHGLALKQQTIEELLAAWVSELPVQAYRGRDVAGFTQDDSGVAISLSDGSSLRAKYLVGCDGGRSLVRKTVGIEFAGWEPSITYLIAEAELADKPGPSFQRDAIGTFALGPIDAVKSRIVIRDDVVTTGEPTLEDLRARLITFYGTDFGLRSASWLSRFSDATRQATSYRAGRVLIAGDAAHVHSPMGGQGLNMGLLDAVNLGWKLAQVARGISPDTLLDTYQAERHAPTARALRKTMAQTALSRGDDRMDAVRESLTELLSMDEPRRRYAALMSSLDHAYDFGPGHPLLGRRLPDVDLVTADGSHRAYEFLREGRPLLLNFGPPERIDLSGWIERVRRVDARVENGWKLPVIGDVRAPESVLVRPDGHVAWVGEGSDAGLKDALAKWFGPPAGT